MSSNLVIGVTAFFVASVKHSDVNVSGLSSV